MTRPCISYARDQELDKRLKELTDMENNLNLALLALQIYKCPDATTGVTPTPTPTI